MIMQQELVSSECISDHSIQLKLWIMNETKKWNWPNEKQSLLYFTKYIRFPEKVGFSKTDGYPSEIS